MKTCRPVATALLALAVLAGCSDRSEAPLLPEAAPPAQLLGGVLGLVGNLLGSLTGVLQFAVTPDLSGPRHAEKRIVAAQGGFVELNGFRVDIPAGALPADTVVTIDLPSTSLLGKRVMAEFGPHGIRFNHPVTLTFPLSGVVLNGNPVEVARWENGAWTSLGGTVTGGGTRLTGQTPTFSYYAGKYVMAGG